MSGQGTETVATVRQIPPRKKELSLKKVAAYCCFSTKAQNQLDGLTAQERYYEKQINANPNWQFAGSGNPISQRKSGMEQGFFEEDFK